MDNENKDLEELKDLEEISVEDNKEVDEVEKRLYDIDIRIQELDVKFDALEVLMVDEDEYINHLDEYNEIKKEIKDLERERKNLKKNQSAKEEKTALDEVSIWVIVYGVLMTIICIPWISYNIWLDFTTVLIEVFTDSLNTVSANQKFLVGVIYVLLIYALPLLLQLVSWILYTNVVKKKTDKKVFKCFWIIQAILSVILMIYMGITFFPDLL